LLLEAKHAALLPYQPKLVFFKNLGAEALPTKVLPLQNLEAIDLKLRFKCKTSAPKFFYFFSKKTEIIRRILTARLGT